MRALLLDIVVAADREQRGLGVFLLLRLDDVADVDQLVLPSVQRNDLSGVVLEQIRDEAAGHRRDDLLAQRRIGHDTVVDRIAADLLVIGDDLFDRDVLFFGGALGPPHGRGRRLGVGDEFPPPPKPRYCEAAYAGSACSSPSPSPLPAYHHERNFVDLVRPNVGAASAIPAQPCAIGYFAKISSTRLNAFSAAACGVIPPVMMSAQATAQTCSFWTWA